MFNNQETFNRSRDHLLTQKRKSVANLVHEPRNQAVPGFHFVQQACMYRSEDGCMCAIGPLIADDDYRTSIEGVSARMIRHLYESHDMELTEALQFIHDRWPVHMWPAMLYHCAKTFELDPGDLSWRD